MRCILYMVQGVKGLLAIWNDPDRCILHPQLINEDHL